jgi:hypothetical protein
VDWVGLGVSFFSLSSTGQSCSLPTRLTRRRRVAKQLGQLLCQRRRQQLRHQQEGGALGRQQRQDVGGLFIDRRAGRIQLSW